MKTQLLITFSLLTFSLSVFSAEIGEDQKSPCPYADQSVKREAKKVIEHNTESEQVEKEVKALSH